MSRPSRPALHPGHRRHFRRPAGFVAFACGIEPTNEIHRQVFICASDPRVVGPSRLEGTGSANRAALFTCRVLIRIADIHNRAGASICSPGDIDVSGFTARPPLPPS